MLEGCQLDKGSITRKEKQTKQALMKVKVIPETLCLSVITDVGETALIRKKGMKKLLKI